MIDRAGPAKPAPSADARDPDPRVVALLKAVVVGLGALILLGLAAVAYRILTLATDGAASDRLPAKVSVTPTPPAATAGSPLPTGFPDATLALPAGATVQSLALDGTRLAVHFNAPSGAGIAILDLASGKALGTVRVTSGGSAP